MAKIKICGLMREVDIDYVNELKPDYVGFILSGGYRRSISEKQAILLKSQLDKSINAVGVFVDESEDYINSFVEKGIIDIVQLHGSEAPQLCKKIKAPVIKCFTPDSFDKISDYEVDYYLFDSGKGTGNCFDWSTLPATDKSFFLAGGINEDNIGEAIKKVNPFCIDLSSAVETNGYKDKNKIKKIMESVR